MLKASAKNWGCMETCCFSWCWPWESLDSAYWASLLHVHINSSFPLWLIVPQCSTTPQKWMELSMEHIDTSLELKICSLAAFCSSFVRSSPGRRSFLARSLSKHYEKTTSFQNPWNSERFETHLKTKCFPMKTSKFVRFGGSPWYFPNLRPFLNLRPAPFRRFSRTSRWSSTSCEVGFW